MKNHWRLGAVMASRLFACGMTIATSSVLGAETARDACLRQFGVLPDPQGSLHRYRPGSMALGTQIERCVEDRARAPNVPNSSGATLESPEARQSQSAADFSTTKRYIRSSRTSRDDADPLSQSAKKSARWIAKAKLAQIKAEAVQSAERKAAEDRRQAQSTPQRVGASDAAAAKISRPVNTIEHKPTESDVEKDRVEALRIIEQASLARATAKRSAELADKQRLVLEARQRAGSKVTSNNKKNTDQAALRYEKLRLQALGDAERASVLESANNRLISIPSILD